VALGGGRTRPQDGVDHSVGYSGLAGIGTKCCRGDRIALVHAGDEASAREAEDRLLACYLLSDDPPETRPVVLSRINEANA
jgi:thymidine phosphorylase